MREQPDRELALECLRLAHASTDENGWEFVIRREIDRRGISIKVIQIDGGWENPSTVLSYFPADEHRDPAIMSVASLHRLIKTKALPVDLLSLLLPDGHAIVRVPEGIDHDELAASMHEYLAAKSEFHHPESEEGRDIGPRENSRLCGKFVKIRATG